MINIQDVAKKAGVSVATVSRVLNETTVVSENTKAKVLAAIEELDYHPNLVGRNLRRKETKIALVIMNSVVNSFFTKIIKGMEDAAAQKGYHIMICTTGNVSSKISRYLDLLTSRLADGAILLGIGLDDALKEKIASVNKRYPLVQCCEYDPELGLSHVSIDDFAAAYEATSYLIEKGRRKILHFSVCNQFISSRQRRSGYLKALADHQIPNDENLVLYGNYGYRNAMRLTSDFLQKSIPFDAILADSDRMAAGAMRVLADQMISVPDDVSVIGFDNTEICYMVQPGITSISQSQYELGTCSFQLLYDQISGGSGGINRFFEHKLILRESTNI